MFDTWGFAGISKNGTANLIDISNWRSVIADLKREFNDEVYADNFLEVNLKHWACGYVDQLTVKILNEPKNHDDIVLEDITSYFRYVCHSALYINEECSIFDESDYSDCQWDSSSSLIEEFATAFWNTSWRNVSRVVEGFGDEVQVWLCDNFCEYVEDTNNGTYIYDEVDMLTAIYDLGFELREDSRQNDFWDTWCAVNLTAVAVRYNRRLEEAGQMKMEFTS